MINAWDTTTQIREKKIKRNRGRKLLRRNYLKDINGSISFLSNSIRQEIINIGIEERDGNVKNVNVM